LGKVLQNFLASHEISGIQNDIGLVMKADLKGRENVYVDSVRCWSGSSDLGSGIEESQRLAPYR
jgi:hypothetical protein